MVRSIFALAAVLSVASASLAGDLVTAPINPGTNDVGCRLGNITSKSISSGEWIVVTVRQTPSTETLAPISMSSVNRSGNSMLNVLSSP